MTLIDSDAQFGTFGDWYDAIYSDKEYSREADFIIDLLEKKNISGKSLLEFGSGTGRHATEFSKSGYSVHGVEKSERMLDKAVGSSLMSFEHGDITKFRNNNKYDAVVCLFHVLGYLTTNENLNAAFQAANIHLSRGGLFVFDYWNASAVLSIGPEVRIKRGTLGDRTFLRIAEPTLKANLNRVDVNYTLIVFGSNGAPETTFQETHAMRYFSIPEIQIISHTNGFELELSQEFLSGSEPSVESWNLISMARKR